MPLSSPRIQSIQQLAPVVEAKCKLSGTVERNTVINRTTVPTPSCAEVGDYQFLLFVLQTNNTPDWSVSNFGHLPGQWKVANWPSYGNSPFVLFRKIEAGHEPFSIAQYGGALRVRYTTFIVSGIVQDNDPIIATVFAGEMGITNSGSQWRDYAQAPAHIPLISNKDLILSSLSHTSNNTGLLITVPPEDGTRVLLSDRNTNFNTSADAGNTAYVLQRLTDDNFVDLNSNTQDHLSGWTLQGTSSLATGNTALEYYVRDNATTGRIGTYKDFYLEAGKTYLFTVDGIQVNGLGSGVNAPAIYLGFKDPDGVDHGACARGSYTTTGTVGSLVSINDLVFTRSYGNSWISTLVIRPAQTGIHQLWFFNLDSGQCASIATVINNRTGNTGRAVRGNFIVVSELKNTHEATIMGVERDNPLYRDYTQVKRVLAPIHRQTSGPCFTAYTVLRGGSGKRPPVRMVNTAHPHLLAYSPGNGRQITNQAGFSWGTVQIFEYSDQLVGRWTHPKYYFEITPTVVDANICFGYVVAGSGNQEITGAAWPTSAPNGSQYLVRSGAHIVGGTTVTGLPAWSNTDVIGLLLDLENNQVVITQNGSPYTTMNIGTDVRRGGWAYRVMITSAINGGFSTAARYEVNLRGPFQYKPVDSVAFDFDNEIA